MKKNVVRINEAQLRKIVVESVKKTLSEIQSNSDDIAKKIFNSIDFKEESLDDVDTDSLDWESIGEGWYKAADIAVFEKNGWKFEAPIVWIFKTGWMGTDPAWDFPGKQCEIKYISPDGQKGIFVI